MSHSQITDSSRALIEASSDLGTSRAASFIRACAVAMIFGRMEQTFAGDKEPAGEIDSLLRSVADHFRSCEASGMAALGSQSIPAEISSGIYAESVEDVTGNHYGRLFSSFSTESFWEEPVYLLRTRLERNGIDPAGFSGLEVLDAGCGGGRYTVAWSKLGAGRAVGVDISSIGIESARRRVAEAGLAGIEFRISSVLALPFPDDSFDVVFSNGVLHHTADWKAGISEIVRVLKPGGFGWLYLIENPGGLFWETIEVMREMIRADNREFARLSLKMIGIPDNRIFYMLDHVMVPINIQLTPAEIEEQLRVSGAAGIRRLERGADFDRIESIHRKDPFAGAKYGVGENRYVFTKGAA